MKKEKKDHNPHMYDPDEFLEYVPKESKVSRNKNNKTISVTNAFDSYSIPVKIIATYKQWKRFESNYLKHNKITLGSLSSHISRITKANLVLLKDYYNDLPDDFSLFFYEYYIFPSKSKNPLCSIKSRGGSPYGEDRAVMYKIRIISSHLYVFLRYWLTKDTTNLPLDVKRFFSVNNIPLNTKPPSHYNDPDDIIIKTIKKRFNVNIEPYGPLNFYNKYITSRSLTLVDKALKNVNYLPTRYPLNEFCSPSD